MLKFHVRYFHQSHRICNEVRVRFAPSPTGYIHLGGLRTALYNFLFARANNGKFILRIEDTDQKRLIPGAAMQLEKDLEWMGIGPDESPLRGGNFGPYVQSQRIELYQQYTEQLIQKELAYHCFCSERRLEFLRKEAVREAAVPRYDNRCRQLTKAAVEEKKRQGLSYCIRFKLEALLKPVEDMVYGQIDYDVAQHEGDPVVLKQDGFPTYHLANVVDDHLMEISHVLRGTEWLVSTPKHVLLYNAFGWRPPRFAHLPLILNADGTKLSKRQNDIQLEHFRSRGYYPGALMNFICMVGGGFASTDFNKESFDIQTLVQNFRLEELSTHSGRLDMLRLEELNSTILKARLSGKQDSDELIENLAQIVKRMITDSGNAVDQEMLKTHNLKKIIHWAVDENRISRLENLVEPGLRFLWTVPKDVELELSRSGHLPVHIVPDVIEWLRSLPEEDRLSRNEVTQNLKRISKRANAKFSDVMKLLRIALTGLKEGPSIGEVIEILGKDIILKRLEQVNRPPSSP